MSRRIRRHEGFTLIELVVVLCVLALVLVVALRIYNQARRTNWNFENKPSNAANGYFVSGTLGGAAGNVQVIRCAVGRSGATVPAGSAFEQSSNGGPPARRC